MSWSLCYPAQCGETILSRIKQKKEEIKAICKHCEAVPFSTRPTHVPVAYECSWALSDPGATRQPCPSDWPTAGGSADVMKGLISVTRQRRVSEFFTSLLQLRATSLGRLRAHLAVVAGDADDDVVVGRRDGRAVDRHAVHPLLVTGNSHGGHGEPEEVKKRRWESMLNTRESERFFCLAVHVCLPWVKAWSNEGGGAHQ